VGYTRRQLLQQPRPVLFDEGSHLVTDHVDVRLLDEAPDLFELFGREIVKAGINPSLLLTLLREVTLASRAALKPTGWLCFFRKSAKAALATS
jgi:hypothetical protein